MRQLLFGVFFISATTCLSAQNSTSNILNKEYFKEKTLVFTYNTSSVQNFNIEGPHAGMFFQPDVKKTFEEAVSEMAKETNINLISGNNSIADQINSKILDITWQFKLFSAELTTKVNFNVNNQNYMSTGSYKNIGGGSERKNLKRALKNSIYNFLLEYQK
ncbi:Uncharacterised protein [Chryseobacterium nakagawai]|uniref:Uncharacterized protein n=1 Tax=Chryseobacterium nakagawai TaxID=1241982 RepID=A0AAD0YHK1_CHRNA|nr:hypothetical protein [Chryseobacterium nakagawai]AZA89245.1 hypothetical protein EG343_00655 [Chryseobacterium nakagawai]VEH20577.1 Uncharacterised protein [Chryseobacterium nakagawai]